MTTLADAAHEPAKASRRWRAAGAFVVVGGMALLFITGAYGVDFGKHWDEHHGAAGVRNSVASLELMPRKYVYHGVFFDLGYLEVLPLAVRAVPALIGDAFDASTNTAGVSDAVDPVDELDDRDDDVVTKAPSVVALQSDANDFLRSPGYLLHARLLFLALSVLIVPFTYLLARSVWQEQRERCAPALWAAAIVATSWEVAYPARYAAIDGPLAALTALALAVIIRFLRARGERAKLVWALAAGAAAGLAFGCKLTGLVCELTALVTVWLAFRDVVDRSLRRQERALHAAACAVGFALAFLATTPGIILDPLRYLAEIAYASGRYYASVSPAHAVTGWPDHIFRLMMWLLGAVPSPYGACAIALSLCAIPGVRALWREDRRTVIVLALFVVMHLALVTSSAKLIVRNSLPLVPVLALFIGAGIDDVARAISARFARRAFTAYIVLIALVALALGANALWLVTAARSIVDTTGVTILDAVADRLRDEPALFSPRLVKAMGARLHCADAADAAGDDVNHVALFALPDGGRKRWRANHPWFAEQIGSLEANYTWYPTWLGKHENERVAVVDRDAAKTLALDLKKYRACRVTR